MPLVAQHSAARIKGAGILIQLLAEGYTKVFRVLKGSGQRGTQWSGSIWTWVRLLSEHPKRGQPDARFAPTPTGCSLLCPCGYSCWDTILGLSPFHLRARASASPTYTSAHFFPWRVWALRFPSEGQLWELPGHWSCSSSFLWPAGRKMREWALGTRRASFIAAILSNIVGWGEVEEVGEEEKEEEKEKQ